MTNQMTIEEIRALGTGFTIENFEELWRAIGRLPFVSQDGPYAWRGVSDSSYNVESSLFRWLKQRTTGVITEKSLRESELRVLDIARKWGLGE